MCDEIIMNTFTSPGCVKKALGMLVVCACVCTGAVCSPGERVELLWLTSSEVRRFAEATLVCFFVRSQFRIALGACYPFLV